MWHLLLLQQVYNKWIPEIDANCADDAPSVLRGYEAAVVDAKGAWAKGAGNYKTRLAGLPTAQACADMCSAPAHAAACHGFSYSAEHNFCVRHTAIGVSDTQTSKGGWNFYKQAAAGVVSISFDLDYGTADLAVVDTVLRGSLANEGVPGADTVRGAAANPPPAHTHPHT